MGDSQIIVHARPRGRRWGPVRALLWEQWRTTGAAFAMVFSMSQLLGLSLFFSASRQYLSHEFETTLAFFAVVLAGMFLLINWRPQTTAQALTISIPALSHLLPVSRFVFSSVYLGYRVSLALVAAVSIAVEVYVFRTIPAPSAIWIVGLLHCGLLCAIVLRRMETPKERAALAAGVLPGLALLGVANALSGFLLIGFGTVLVAIFVPLWRASYRDVGVWHNPTVETRPDLLIESEGMAPARSWVKVRWPELRAQIWYEANRGGKRSILNLIVVTLFIGYFCGLYSDPEPGWTLGHIYAIWTSALGEFNAMFCVTFILAGCVAGMDLDKAIGFGNAPFSQDKYWSLLPQSLYSHLLAKAGASLYRLRWAAILVASAWLVGIPFVGVDHAIPEPLRVAAGVEFVFALLFAALALASAIMLALCGAAHPFVGMFLIFGSLGLSNADQMIVGAAAVYSLLIGFKVYKARLLSTRDTGWYALFLFTYFILYTTWTYGAGAQAPLYMHAMFALVAPLSGLASFIHPYINARGR